MKQIVKINGEYLLRLDKIAVDNLCLNEDSELQIIIIENKLIVTVKNFDYKKRREEITRQMMDEYAPVLKKLAKI